MKDERPDWFSPKRYGYGAGLPIRWQGWVVLTLYLGVTVGAAWLFRDRIPAFLAIVIPATVLLMIVAARTTRGGWRWRWGGD